MLSLPALLQPASSPATVDELAEHVLCVLEPLQDVRLALL
jgi:hypothetical protein